MNRLSMNMLERRSVKRIPVIYRCSFGSVSLGKHEGSICDLAMKGCRLESPVPVRMNTYFELWLQVSPTAPRILVELATVRWGLDRQLGIEFLALRPEHKAKLKEILEWPSSSG
jgi:hypothetical protein